MTASTILVATDFSTDAQRATERAARLCAQGVFTHGRLLHVIQQSWVDTVRRLLDLPAEREEKLLSQTREQLLDEARSIAARSDVEFDTCVRIGSIDQIVREEASRADVLALGARGRHPVRDFAIGTTAEHLLRQTRTPLLVVRRDAPENYRKVLVATDFSPHAQRAFTLACTIAPEATIHLRHMFDVPFEGMLHFAGLDAERIEEYRRSAQAEASAEMRAFIAASGVDPARVQHESQEQRARTAWSPPRSTAHLRFRITVPGWR